MKKLFLLFVFLLSMLPVFCQSNNFELFRCSSATLKRMMPAGDWQDTTYTNLFYLISYDYDNLIVTFDNSSATKLYISGVINKSVNKDNENNEYTEMTYYCHDQDNVICHLTVDRYKESPNTVFKLEYSNMVVVLHAKLVKGITPAPVDNNSNNNNSDIKVIS